MEFYIEKISHQQQIIESSQIRINQLNNFLDKATRNNDTHLINSLTQQIEELNQINETAQQQAEKLVEYALEK